MAKRATFTGISRAAAIGTGVFGAITASIAVRMLWYLCHSQTNVLFLDQWPMLEEIRRLDEHRSGWNYLWAPYWGHRLVIPRLLFLMSARLFSFSNKPLILVSVLAQFCTAGILCFADWKLLGQRSRVWACLTMGVTVNLVLSPLQLENFISPRQILFPVGYLAAVASIAALGWGLRPGQPSRRQLFLGCASVLLAVAATLTIASGCLVWPVLCLEAWILKCPKKYLLFLAAVGTVAVLCYAAGYARPDLGMGFGGMARRPIAALRIMGLLLGGPLSLVSLTGGTLAGCAGTLVAAAYLVPLTIRRHSAQTDAVIPAMLALYFLGVALSVVAGRISPEWLAERQGVPLPSRYFTPSFFFWASLFPLAVPLTLQKEPLARMAAAAVGAVVLALTLGTLGGQISEPVHWSIAFRQMDAAASAFFIPADDEETMAAMYPEAGPRDRGVEYLRTRGWSVFSEDRATWIGKKLQDKFTVLQTGVCGGYLQSVKAIGSSSLRLTGHVLVNQTCPGDPVEIVITRRNGIIVGLGRSTLPVFTPGGGKEAGFLAYARIEGGANDLLVYAGGPDHRMSLLMNVEYP